jgi:uncharacterized protein RhaS with RHS repeats
MQARYYDPVIGRFYSNDPAGFNGNNPMTFNRYAYANNNPYKYTDPDGRTAIPFPLTPMDTGVGPTGMQNLTSEQQAAGVGALIDVTPVVGDIKAIGEAVSNPTVANIAAAAVGVVPVVGDAAAAGIKANKGVQILKNGEKHVTSKDTKTSFSEKLEKRGFEKGSDAKGNTNYTKGDVKYTLKHSSSGMDTAYRNDGKSQTHKIRLKDE